ncbi:hypothetical protein FIBSPDRAFT_901537 [Athelia psychrophila]|uniref:PX domain-containing protein n=1 Tax=Athelia psychrophila TaxID=1759441 RepID=A0A165X130_9AGAM|nr:hypothetical protein FIBSPDRAFT_901537 [Fibularhizoctonia sp. CBS 109695]
MSEDHSNGVVGPAQPALTPLQTQYLAKILAQLAMSRASRGLSADTIAEWASLNDVGSLTTFGLPFSGEPAVPDKKLRTRTYAAPAQPPILRYLFRHFVLTFPGLQDAPHKYWTKIVQPMFDDAASRNLPGSKERSEVTKRRTVAIALTNYIGTVFFKGLHPYTSAPARPSRDLLQRIDDMFPPPQTEAVGGFFVAIVKIDLVRRKPKPKPQAEGTEGHEDADADTATEEPAKRVQTEQYLLCTRPGDGEQEVFVYRDYSTFQKFDKDLADTGLDKPALPGPGASGFPSKESLQLYLRALLAFLAHDPESPVSFKLKSFLLGFALALPAEKRRTLLERVQADEGRLAGAHAAWAAAGATVADMRAGWAVFVGGLLAGDGLDASFALLKDHASIYALPLQYRRAAQWASAYTAYALHYLFVAAPNANEAFFLLQLLHHFFPYALARQLLKIANPAAMIKAFMALLFGEPLGAKSVFSRVFAGIEGRHAKAHRRQIARYRTLVADSAVCDRLRAFVHAGRAEQEKVREKSRTDEVDLVVSILVRAGLSEAQEEDVLECYHAFQDGVAAGDPTLLEADGAVEDSASGLQATKFKWLKRLLRLESLSRGNREGLRIWEGTFETFFRETVALYYPVISAVSKASNLSARLGDLQKFLDDMVRVVLGKDRSPRQFVQLAQRHEQSLYYFLHEIHANGKGLTVPLIEWLRKGLDLMSGGIRTAGEKPISVNLEALLATSPAIAPKVLAEIDATANYIMWNKARYELSLRAAVLGADASAPAPAPGAPLAHSAPGPQPQPHGGHVDVDGLLRALMEGAGQDVSARLAGASAFGMVDWGYFYDPQVVDTPTDTVLEGEEPPRGDGDDGASVAPSTTGTTAAASRRAAPAPRHGETSAFIKPPLLMETRKLLEAYYAQIGPALDGAADAEQWAGKIKSASKK